MVVKLGDLDITKQIVENEYRIGVLEAILEWIVNRHFSSFPPITQEVMQGIREKVIEDLKNRYPNVNINIPKE
jgi:hypothetical protein